ncbi:MAG TPA: YlbF family regulator, partial [Verrucomicrobiae bacterium]|nr:YlbF family regulator [Verrucomicrobiae bacterium]
MPTKLEEKTQELCAAIVAQPEMAAIRRRIDAFLSDANSRGQYDTVNNKGQTLHQKQHDGQPLNGEEIADFEKHRDALLQNPVARDFLEAQDQLHEMQHLIQKYVNKTFELGRVPTDA